MTRYDRMCNDRLEGGYVLDLYGDVIGSMKSEGTVPGDYLEAISDPDIELSRVEPNSKGRRIPVTPYVLCFSTNRNDTDMGDHYGGEGGGWIEFRGFIWQFGNYGQNINAHHDANMLLGFRRIEYEGENVKKRIREMILKFHNVGAGNPELVRECIWTASPDESVCEGTYRRSWEGCKPGERDTPDLPPSFREGPGEGLWEDVEVQIR